MIQKIQIQKSSDPFDIKVVKFRTEDNVKIMSSEKYVVDTYKMYEGFLPVGKETYDITDKALMKCKIDSIKGDFATIEINPKYSTSLDLSLEKKEFRGFIQENSVIDLKISKENKKDIHTASLSNAVGEIKRNEILNSIGKGCAYMAKVTELIHGGYYLLIDGIKVFMPGSLASANKLSNFEELVGKTLAVVPVNFSIDFKMIVVSHRDYLKTIKPLELSKVELDIKYKGRITGVGRHGIFIEFNTASDIEQPFVLTGLLPVSEMCEETFNKFTNKDYKSGEYYSFYVKSIVDDNKIIFTDIYVDWEKFATDYKVGTETEVMVVKIVDKLLFCQIKNTQMVGSIFEYDKPCEVGSLINCFISKIDILNKKIFLSMSN